MSKIKWEYGFDHKNKEFELKIKGNIDVCSQCQLIKEINKIKVDVNLEYGSATTVAFCKDCTPSYGVRIL